MRSQPEQQPGFPPLTRREVLKLMSLGAGAWVLSACAPEPAGPAVSTATPTTPSSASTAHEAATAQPTATAQAEALQTPIGMPELPAGFEAGRLTHIPDFYVQNSNGVVVLDQFEWRLSLSGLLDTPRDLSLLDIKRFPAIEVMRTLECIGNPVGGTLIGNATWTGVALRAVLEEAGIQPEARHILFLSADDYETNVMTELAMDERSLIVHEMNGEPLTVEHGFPARILLPGVYGQKQPKWVTSIRASERDRLGTWENRGWSNTAVIQINSRVETPKLRQMIPAGESFFITGIALSDTSGIRSVDVSIDDGGSWMPAELLSGPDAGVWTLWYWHWQEPQPGKYVVLARATDGNGQTQTATGQFGVLDNVFPNGTSLMHSVSVTVV